MTSFRKPVPNVSTPICLNLSRDRLKIKWRSHRKSFFPDDLRASAAGTYFSGFLSGSISSARLEQPISRGEPLNCTGPLPVEVEKPLRPERRHRGCRSSAEELPGRLAEVPVLLRELFAPLSDGRLTRLGRLTEPRPAAGLSETLPVGRYTALGSGVLLLPADGLPAEPEPPECTVDL